MACGGCGGIRNVSKRVLNAVKPQLKGKVAGRTQNQTRTGLSVNANIARAGAVKRIRR